MGCREAECLSGIDGSLIESPQRQSLTARYLAVPFGEQS